MQMETSTGTTALCRNGMQIVCGGADGTIVLRDFRKRGPPSLLPTLPVLHVISVPANRRAPSAGPTAAGRQRRAREPALTRACVRMGGNSAGFARSTRYRRTWAPWWRWTRTATCWCRAGLRSAAARCKQPNEDPSVV
jgi:hypothetical protein